jgi:Protein of unknown function (DUF1329)
MNWRVSFALILLLTFAVGISRAQGPAEPEPADMQGWLGLTGHQGPGIAPGTRITIANWQNYQKYMPLGMIDLFKGTYFWQIPQDVEIDVGPMVSYPLPHFYVGATEKNSGQVRVVHLADGNNDIANYTGGEPFPSPQEPDKGYKLLTDLWFAYTPYLSVGGTGNPVHSCTQDRFGGVYCQSIEYVYRQLAYNTDPRAASQTAQAPDIWFTEWLMVESPEQSKYTAQLTLFPKDNQRNEELYVFLPSLRRSVRLSVSARCSPVLGTDLIQDDYKSNGFNGGIAMFDAKFLGRRKLLTLFGDYKPLAGDFPNNYDMPLGWPKPSWGVWQLRDVDVIDVRRVLSKRNRYCVGSRIIYEDAQTHYAVWEEIFDANLKLWKTALAAQREVEDPAIGFVPGPVTSMVWDVQNDHMTNLSTEDKFGHDLLPNTAAPAEYQDINRYSMPGGLVQILK